MTISRRALIALLLGAATLAVYSNVGEFDFVEYDDPIYVIDNPHLQAGLGVEGLRWAFTEPYETNWIPLTWLSLLVDHQLYGLEPAGYHWTNVALHLSSVVLLFWVLAGWTGAPGRSAFVAGVFALHPLHVESVAWISERKDCLAGLFWMLGLAAYAGYVRRPAALRFGAVLLCLTLGLLSKALLVSFPFALLLLDLWPLRRLQQADGSFSPRLLRRAVLEKVAMLPLVLAASAITYWVQRDTGAMSSLEQIALDRRLENAALALVAYLKDAVWPSGLAAFYPYPPESPDWTRLLAAVGLMLALSALAAGSWRRRPYLTVGWFWFLGTLFPMIGLVQVGMQSMADRYMYVPLVGLSIAVAWGARDALGRSAMGRAALALAGVGALLAFAVGSHRQLEHWRDTEHLFAQALRVTEENFVAHHGLGRHFLDRGEVEAALPHLAAAARIMPRWAAARAGLGEAMKMRGDLDAAILNYREAIALKPKDVTLRSRYGQLLIDRGWPQDALPHLAAVLGEATPAEAARVRLLMGVAEAESGHPERALQHYRRALELDPELAEARANLALLQLEAGDAADAEAALRAALEQRPGHPDLHSALADALRIQGRDGEAADRYRTVLRLRPDDRRAANNLAWLLATSADSALRDPAGALALAERAASGSGSDDITILDTLAVAQAAVGRFEAAIETLDRALVLARAGDDLELVAELAARRAEFAAGRSFGGGGLP